MQIDLSAYCTRCGDDELAYGTLCTRTERVDLGEDREEGLARYEGLCMRCCSHNHG